MRPSPMTFLRTAFTCIGTLGVCILASYAQTQEEFVLNNGRRLAANTVKVTPNGFTATYLVGTLQQTLNFTAKDVARTSLHRPNELTEARVLIASEKAQEAIETLTKVEVALRPYQALPDSWWVRAALLHMDALSVLGQHKEALAIASPEVISKLSPEDAGLMTKLKEVLTPPTDGALDQAEKLKVIAKDTVDSWLEARIWLEIGNNYSNGGKIEDAVKSWLHVSVFFPAERDLSLRGTVLAARGLQQIHRADDGIKLLDDYLQDNIGTPYKETIVKEKGKLKPKEDNSTNAPAVTPDNNAAPAASPTDKSPAPAAPPTDTTPAPSEPTK
jgi:tetratricopeptide (TPR) repeat protein